MKKRTVPSPSPALAIVSENDTPNIDLVDRDSPHANLSISRQGTDIPSYVPQTTVYGKEDQLGCRSIAHRSPGLRACSVPLATIAMALCGFSTAIYRPRFFRRERR